jgi:hypothetical protein
MVDNIREDERKLRREERRDALRNAQACADLIVASLCAVDVGEEIERRADELKALLDAIK